jgi:1-acyl-sn-glycerol-3-phosphate acyltransferase
MHAGMIAGIIRLITGAQARWAGEDPIQADGSIPQRIFFANHGSNLDAPVIWASLPNEIRNRTRPVAARDYWDGGKIRRYLAHRVFRCVLIERQKVTKSSNPLVAMEEALDQGSSLIIFPEGRRAFDEDGEMGEFKPGLWHLAKKHPNVQLVPVFLENLNRILPKGDFILIPLQAAVTFGRAIHPEEGEEKLAFLQRARSAIEELSKRGST